MISFPRWIVGLAVAALLPLASAAAFHEGYRSGAGDPDPAVLEELERGRYWHASRLLARAESTTTDPLLRARAEAGWGNWPAVWELLRSLEGVAPEEEARAQALRGRAAEEVGRSDEAATSYRRALEAPTTLASGEPWVLRIRLARTLAATGSFSRAQEVLERVVDGDAVAGSWLALEIANRAAEEGRVQAARSALGAISGSEVRRRSWSVLGRAHLAAGDTAAALAAFLARAGDPDDGAAWSRIGSLRLALADSGAAGRAFRNALARGPDAASALGVLDLGVENASVALRAYRALRTGGDDEAALTALERYVELVGAPLPDTLRMERARLLSRTERTDEAVDELRELSSGEDGDLAAQALELWARIWRGQGRAGDARAIQNRLVERFPSRPEAVDVVFFRADDRHDRGDRSGALAGYRRAVEMAPELDRAGLARMRMGQIHVTEGRHQEAAGIFEGYLEAFPRGRRWDEARFWAAWTRTALGQDDRAREQVRRIQEEDPLSYYAILGARLLGEPFTPPIPEGAPPPRVPAIEIALDRIQLLRDAGLESAVPVRVRELRRRYRASGDTLLRLSLELSERGFSLDGITLGWEIRGEGREWDRWLVRAVFPFPYRELVRLEAEEWGLDPLSVAALIRQESAFLADARSGAGAMGLMQVVPSTGRSLARSVGPDPFAEHHLLHPEVNLHLGAAFLARMHERFEGRTALALAAYNAGPTRARRWERSFPEVEDPLRFTERIPYRETRGYVKRVTRNVDIYRWLYGEEG